MLATRELTLAAYRTIKGLIPKRQARTIADLMAGEEGEWFETRLIELAAIIDGMPKVYEQDGKGDQAMVYLHYFTGGCDWWITEKDSEAEQHQAYGYADIGYGAEQGYISLVELMAHPSMEIDLHFTPCTVAELVARKRLDK